MAEFEMVDQQERLVGAILKMKQLEDEKKQAMSEFFVYTLAREIRDGGAPSLSDSMEEVPDAEEVYTEEITGLIGGESVDPQTGEISKKDAGGNHAEDIPGGLPGCYGQYGDNESQGCRDCSYIDGCKSAPLTCPYGYTEINVEEAHCNTCPHFATCGLPEAGEEE